jgi:hypothetical protein
MAMEVLVRKAAACVAKRRATAPTSITDLYTLFP